MTVVIPTGARVIDIDLDTIETNVFKNVPYETHEQFYSTDIGMAFLKFTGLAQDYTGCTARLTLINFNDGSKVQRIFEMDTTTTFVYPMKETELVHAGRWIGQLAVIKGGTTISDNPFRFKINGPIMSTALISFDNINTFTDQLTTIYDGLNTFLDSTILSESGRTTAEGLRVVAEGLRVTADALRETKEGTRQTTFEANEVIRDGIVNSLVTAQTITQKVAEKYQLIESTQASRLLTVEQQLEQKVSLNGAGQVGWANIAQDARLQIIGTTPPAVVGTNAVLEANIVDGAVTLKKLEVNAHGKLVNTPRLSKNMFNKYNVSPGKVSSGGSVVSEYNSFVSEFISITPSEAYAMSLNGTILPTAKPLAFYDSNKNFLTFLGATTNPFNAYLAARFIRITVVKADLDTFQFEQNSVATTYANYYTPETNVALMLKDKDKPMGVPSLNADGNVVGTSVDSFAHTTKQAVDDADPSIVYTGTWTAGTNYPTYHDSTRHLTMTIGDSVEFTFTGTGIEVYDSMGTNRGNVEVLLDGIWVGTAGRYSTVTIDQSLLYKVDKLPYGTHTIKLTALDSGRVNNYFVFDYFNVLVTESRKIQDHSPVSVLDANSGTSIKLWVGTQVEYDAIITKDNSTVYLIGV